MRSSRKSDSIRRNNRRRRRKSEWAGVWFLLPSLTGVLCFLALPYLDVVRRSFLAAAGGSFVGLGNYRSIFSNPAFLLAAGNTIRFTAVCIPLLLAWSLLFALILQKCRGGQRMKSMFLVPMALPVASVVLLFQFLFHRQGFLNGLLHRCMGISSDTAWLASGAAFWVLVGCYLWKNMGYDIVLWLAGLAAIPESIYEAAKVDGAGSWKCFWYITMPNLLPSLFTIAVLSLLNSFKVFREAYLVGGDYPHESMYLLQHLFNNWFRELSLDKMAAAAVVNGIVIFALIRMLEKLWER